MTCQNCGNEHGDGVRFCPHCGKNVKHRPIPMPSKAMHPKQMIHAKDMDIKAAVKDSASIEGTANSPQNFPAEAADFWTTKDILIGKTFYFLLLTAVLSIILSRLDAAIVLKLMHLHIDGSNAVLAIAKKAAVQIAVISYYLVFLFAILLSIAGLKWYYNTHPIEIPEGIENIRAQQRALLEIDLQKRFKWSGFYGIICGYLFLFALIYLSPSRWILWIILSMVTAKGLNKWMMKKTSTNRLLIEALVTGLYDDVIPGTYSQNEIKNVLQKGYASSVSGAVAFLNISGFGKKIAKVSAIAGVAFTTLVTVLTLGIINAARDK